jgi:hypothetical protein
MVDSDAVAAFAGAPGIALNSRRFGAKAARPLEKLFVPMG